MTTAPSALSPEEQGQQAQHMLHLLGGFQVSQALYVAAKLGVPDVLVSGPLDTAVIAERVGASPERLFRVLRTLASVGTFAEGPPRVFANTPLSESLRSSGEGCASVRSMAITLHETHYEPFTSLLDNVKGSTKTGSELVYGKPFFEHLEEDEERLSTFADAMTSMTNGARGPIEQHISSDVADKAGDVICDVGGGNGHVACQILGVRPEASAVVFDLPHLATAANDLAQEEGFSDRCSFVAGSFFDAASIPQNATLYFLGFILHDWNDEECVTILSNVRKAMKPDSRLCVAEMLVGPMNKPGPAKSLDLTMLGIVSGRERREDEYNSLLSKSGFKLTKVIATGRPVSLIMAEPVE